MNGLYQSADWKSEKHAPVIEAPGAAKRGEAVLVKVLVGKEIAHPNTTAHHIAWMEVYFHPDGEKFPQMLGRFDFCAHGAGADGPDSSTVYTEPHGEVAFKTEKPGKILAASYCNIHGLWESEVPLRLE